jgi:3-oxoisoapionate kinase
VADSAEQQSLDEGLLLSFYGDDFTGSTDGMEALARAGLRTVLFLSPPSPEQLARFAGLRAVGVAGISRSLTPAAMDAELSPIFARLRALPAPLFHVKVCSTFDSSPDIGSIGHTIDIGQRLFASPFVPLVVGAPILNRFCIFGNLFARSGPESEVFRLDRHPTMSRHPVTPMHESDLRLHLACQTARPIGLIDTQQLAQPPEAIKAAVNLALAGGAEILLFDTLTDDHLVAIGREIWQRASHDRPLFAIGSSGVEYALTAYWLMRGWLSPPPPFHADPVERIVVVSGSCSPVTARQIEWGVANGFVEIPLLAAELTDESAIEQAISATVCAARTTWDQGRSVIIHTCRGPEDPRLTATQQATEPRDHGPLLGWALGRILSALIAQTDLRRAIVAGGDTSGYVARTLGIEALEMQTPIAPGSPLCRVYAADRRLDGMEMLFKGGQVGKIDLFGSVLKGRIGCSSQRQHR